MSTSNYLNYCQANFLLITIIDLTIITMQSFWNNHTILNFVLISSIESLKVYFLHVLYSIEFSVQIFFFCYIKVTYFFCVAFGTNNRESIKNSVQIKRCTFLAFLSNLIRYARHKFGLINLP